MTTATPLTCTAERLTPTAVRIDVAGELAFPRAHLLHETVTELLAQGGLSTLVLDFTNLSFLDSSGLSALLKIRREATAAGLTLQLEHCTEQLDAMLHRTGLHTHLTGGQRSDRASGTSVPEQD